MTRLRCFAEGVSESFLDQRVFGTKMLVEAAGRYIHGVHIELVEQHLERIALGVYA
jgi:hypothetical protein